MVMGRAMPLLKGLMSLPWEWGPSIVRSLKKKLEARF